MALNFSYSILRKLCDKESIRQETEQVKAIEVFLRENQILDRFGLLGKKNIEAIKNDYDEYGKVDKDILFAYHALTPENERAFLSMLSGLFSAKGNTQDFADNMSGALEYTVDRFGTERERLGHRE